MSKKPTTKDFKKGSYSDDSFEKTMKQIIQYDESKLLNHYDLSDIKVILKNATKRQLKYMIEETMPYGAKYDTDKQEYSDDAVTISVTVNYHDQISIGNIIQVKDQRDNKGTFNMESIQYVHRQLKEIIQELYTKIK